MFLVSSANAEEVNRIGVVDFQRIFQSSEGGKKVDAKIKDDYKNMLADLQEKKKEIDELRSQFERESLVMDSTMREEKQREIRIVTNDFTASENRFSKSMQDLQNKLTNRLRKEILRLVEKIGKEEGYTLVLDKGVVAYSISSIDITDQLIPMVSAANITLD